MKESKNKSFIRLSVIIFALILITVVAILGFTWNLNQNSEKSVISYLESGAMQNVNSFKINLYEQFSFLESCADYIATFDDIQTQCTVDLIALTVENARFSRMGISTADGISKIDSGELFDISEKDYFKNALLGEKYISNPQPSLINNNPIVILSIPIEKDNTVAGVLAASYSPHTFIEILAPYTFEGQGRVNIIQTNGNIIATNIPQENIPASNNLFDLYSEAKFTDYDSLDTIKQKVLANELGHSRLNYGGVDRIMDYRPLGINDWYIFSSLPVSIADAQANSISGAMYATVAIIFICSLLLILLIIFNQRNVTKTLYNINAELKMNEERYRIVSEISDNIVYEYDVATKVISHSKNFTEVFGSEPTFENFPQAVIDHHMVHEDDMEIFKWLYSPEAMELTHPGAEFRIMTNTNRSIWCNVSYTAIFDDKGKPTRLVGRIVDISKQKQELENLKIISQTDSLTQLYNKTSLRALVEDFLANSPKDKIHSLFVIDIDKFKDVNDSFGHLMGDDILVRVSNDIKSVFRESDILSRFGGDEFVVFMKNISGSEFAINKANELLNKFRYTIGKDDVVLKVTGSIGISIYNEHGSTFDELFSKADTALYRAKENGRDRSVMFK